MSDHHFTRGDLVYLTSHQASATHPAPIYEVIARLCSEEAEPRYQVKTAGETFSRVTLEYLMRSAPRPETTRAALNVAANVEGTVDCHAFGTNLLFGRRAT